MKTYSPYGLLYRLVQAGIDPLLAQSFEYTGKGEFNMNFEKFLPSGQTLVGKMWIPEVETARLSTSLVLGAIVYVHIATKQKDWEDQTTNEILLRPLGTEPIGEKGYRRWLVVEDGERGEQCLKRFITVPSDQQLRAIHDMTIEMRLQELKSRASEKNQAK